MKKTKIYKKKVIVTDEKTTPQARAMRLKMVRNMANLSREEMCADGKININTYKGWEIGRYGGLPLDGAELVVERVAKEGVVCTSEWLIYEIGRGAYVSADFKKAQKDQKGKKRKTIINSQAKNQEKLIFNEILLFRKQFPDVIDCQILDDGLSPRFVIGDFVAGVKHYNEAIDALLNQDCIVQLSNGEVIIRRLRKGSIPSTYMLTCTNQETIVDTPVLYDVKIFSAAPILRHYKKYK